MAQVALPHDHRLHPLTFFSIVVLAFFVLVPQPSHCFNPRSLSSSTYYYNVSKAESFDWSPAGATYYGEPEGAGSDGGACGYQGAVEQPPFSKFISAGGPSLYQNAKGCGACYEVKCTDNEACSGNSVIVTITDECAGCTAESVHFDLSGTSFGAMAKPGQEDQLRAAGILQIEHKRVDCNYPGTKITIRIDQGSNPHYLSFLILYADGDGTINQVELQESSQQGTSWTPMEQSWGALWVLDSSSGLQGPFSIRITQTDSGKSLVMSNVIPADWQPGQTYTSDVNFN